MRLIIQPHREECLAGGDSRASQKSQPAAGSQEARLGGLVEPWYGWNLTGHSERPSSQVHLTFLTYSFHVWWKMDLISPVGAFETGSPHKEKTKINWDIDTAVILHCADNECGTWGGLLYPLRYIQFDTMNAISITEPWRVQSKLTYTYNAGI